MSEDQLRDMRIKLCHEFLKDPTQNAWNKLEKGVKEISRKWLGLSDEDARLATEFANEEYGGEDCQVDEMEDNFFSPTDDGTWVSAWVYVLNRQMGILPEAPSLALDEETERLVAGLQRPQLEYLLGETLGYKNLARHKDDELLRNAVRAHLDDEELELDDLLSQTEND